MPESMAVTETIPGTGIDADGATIADLAGALATGQVTARALTDFCLSRIERLDPLLHSVISVSGDAPAQAQASDTARASGAAPGPLAGIPVLVKDNIATRGLPATAGSPALPGAACRRRRRRRIRRRPGQASRRWRAGHGSRCCP